VSPQPVLEGVDPDEIANDRSRTDARPDFSDEAEGNRNGAAPMGDFVGEEPPVWPQQLVDGVTFISKEGNVEVASLWGDA
jgi:hypothetical protein